MILAVTQVRISSTRFPEKVLKKVAGKSLLEIHLMRIKKSKLIDKIVVAIADEPGAADIEAICKICEVDYGRGSLSDVLDRLYHVAKPYNPLHLVRLTSDCPLIDPQIIDSVIDLHLKLGTNYTSNVHPPSFADGLDVEVVDWLSFEKAFLEASEKSDREHVMSYLWKNPNLFSQANFINKKDDSSLRLTVDYPEDLLLLNELIAKIGPWKPHVEYVNILRNDPEIRKLNEQRSRNEKFGK